MGQKTNNRILWHGNGLNAEGKAVAPVKAVAGGDGTDGLNEGELYICNSDSDPALFILTDAGNVVRIDGNGSDTYTREQINEKLNAKVDVAFFSRMFGLIDEEGGEIQVNDVETLASSIKAKLGFWTEQYLSAKGKNPDAGSTPGGGGATTLAALTDVSITTTPKDGQVLAYDITMNKWKPVDMEATAGIDEAQLADYLTTNKYAKKADITSALTDYALKTTRIKAGTGLTGGGTLAQDVTLSLATVGTAGTYTKVTVDSYGRVTGHGSLAAGDIPALAISKITGLQAALDAKMDAADFEELFEKVYVSGYGYAIRAKLALYTDSWMSAKGSNPDAGSTTGGVDESEVLQIVQDAGYITSAALNGYATQSWVRGLGYATQSWVNSQGFLTDDSMYFRTMISTLPSQTLTGIPTDRSGSYILTNSGWNGSAFIFRAGSSNSNIGFLYKGGQAASSAKINLIATNDSNPSAWADLGVLVTSGNYTDYTVTKTGGGASGTWGIGISGNAGTATRLATARTLWGQSFNGTGNVSGSLTDVGSITMSGSIMADGTIDSQNFVLGKSLSSISNFQQDVFGTTAWGYKLTAIRWDGTDSTYGARWSPMIAVATNDTSGFITLSSSSADTCYIGGGGASSLTWRAKLFNDSMNLVPRTRDYSVGSASIPWYEMHAARFIASDFLQVGSARLRYDSANNALYVQKSDGTQCGFYATGFVSAKGANDDAGDTEATVLTIADERNTAIYPDTYAGRGIRGLFRANATDGLNDGGTYHTVMHIRQWADSSGGLSHQLAFTDNGGVWHRTATSETAWGEWSELSALSGLGDVAISSPVNGQSLVYRNGVWKNEMVSGGGSASVNWDDINGKPSWIPNTDGSGSGIDADLLDGTHKSGLFTAMTYSGSTLSITIGGTRRTATIEAGGGGASSVSVSSSSSRNISVTVDGATDYVNDLYATYSTYADQLRTARTIWGQSFNGSGSISGNMTGVGSITASGTIKGTQMFAINKDMLLYGPYSNNRVLSFGWSRANGDYMTYWIPGAASHDDIRMELVQNIRGIMVYDNIRYKGTCSASSDMRLKERLGDLDLTVAQVAAAPSFRFKWRNRNETAIGSSAQYWVDILPDAVCKDTDDYLMMAYGNLALAAVITTARTVVDHEQRIRRLEDALKVAV